MSTPNPDIREMVKRSWSVAEGIESLTAELAKGDENKVEDAVDDLLAAYDNYSRKAKTYSSRFAFDEVAAIPDPLERDQVIANGLASVLVDLEMAVALANAAQATGEIEGDEGAAELADSGTRLSDTLTAMQGASETPWATTRFAFDEIVASVPADRGPSPDLATAKANYEGRVVAIYDELVKETYDVAAAAFNGISHLDMEKIAQGLEAIGSPLNFKAVKRIAARVLETVNRVLDTLKKILGPELFGQIRGRIDKVLDEIRKGENIARLFLKSAFEFDTGQKRIMEWLKVTKLDEKGIDQGANTLADLQQQITQAFTIEKRIIATLRLLSWPLGFILKKVGGSLPLDLIMGAAYVLVVDIAVLRGMDYADTTSLISLVDGITTTSKRALEVA